MKLRDVVTLAAGCAFAILGYRLGYSYLLAPLEHGELSVLPEHLDFGTAIVQDDFVWRIPVENRSSRPMEVVGIERSCGCASVSPAAFTLDAYENRWLTLSLNLHQRGDFAFSGEARDFSVELRPVIARAMTPGTPWIVKGKVQSPFRVIEPTRSFAVDALIAGADFQPLVLTLEPCIPLGRIEAHLEARSAPATLLTETRGGATRMQLTPDVDLAPGVHDFRIAVTPFTPDGKRLPRQRIRVVGRVVTDVLVEPSYVRLTPTNDRAEVRLRSRSGASFELLNVDSTTHSVSATRTDDAVMTFDVRLLSAGNAAALQEVRFRVRSSNVAIGELAVPLQVVMGAE